MMSCAHPALNSKGTLAYTVVQQGSGLVNAHDAAYGTASNCANQGLNVALDLAGTQHFGGRANRDSNGNYYIMSDQRTTTCSGGGGLLGGLVGGLLCVVKDVLSIVPLLLDGLFWNGSYTSGSGYTWRNGYTWSNGYTSSKGYTWTDGYTWSNGYTWSTGNTVSGTDLSSQP